MVTLQRMMNRSILVDKRKFSSFHHPPGQSMVEFALILPLFVLFIVGTFELGRVFFSYIAITNAAREGTRVVTFWPGKTTITNVVTAVKTEIGSSPMVNVNNISSIQVECGNPIAILTSDAQLKACPTEEPVRVTVTYQFDPILKFFFTKPLMLSRSAEMMVP